MQSTPFVNSFCFNFILNQRAYLLNAVTNLKLLEERGKPHNKGNEGSESETTKASSVLVIEIQMIGVLTLLSHSMQNLFNSEYDSSAHEKEI